MFKHFKNISEKNKNLQSVRTTTQPADDGRSIHLKSQIKLS